jgi:uncharacterized protein (DUF58 family)
MSFSPRDLEFQAEALAASLPPLLVGAGRVAASLAQGSHGRRRSGPGESFWQFRRYQPGDSANAIDWRQSAKSDPLYVRETEWAAAQTIWVWPDRSASMRWRSRTDLPEKRQRAALLALTAAAILLQGGERLGVLGGIDGPSTGRSAMPLLANAMFGPGEENGGLPDVPVSRQAHLLLFSDFLMPLDMVGAQLQRWAEGGVRGILIHLLDPAEIDLPYQGRVRFVGLEGEGALVAPRAEALRAAYASRLTAHRAALADMARAIGWGFLDHRTDAAPQETLVALHGALAGR